MEYKYSGSRKITEYCSLLDKKRFNTANINRKMRFRFIFFCLQPVQLKKIDKKRDKIIEMLQPSPLTGKKLFEQSFGMNLLLNSSILQE